MIFIQKDDAHVYKAKKSGKHLGRTCLYTTETFIAAAQEVHGAKYDYSEAVYVNLTTKMTIKCNDCGDVFYQIPENHLKGHGCRNCKRSKPYTTETFIKAVQAIHGEKYDYSMVNYVNTVTKVYIKCNKCETLFVQTPDRHLRGSGCRKCADISQGNKNRYNTETFIELAKKKHGETRYDYHQVFYVNGRTKVKIKCNKCSNVFFQKPIGHIGGHGCPHCAFNTSKSISQKETLWLDSLDIATLVRTATLRLSTGRRVVVDGYDPQTNTVYEFLGDYWHGNPNKFTRDEFNKRVKKTFGELFDATIQRQAEIIANGYKLVTMWEMDWKRQ
jgi:Zn finger protein HypA/HybF involved in hydrogenase expression